jgi:two-component system nitrate/nitrite sensor histidine kinase NarX
LILIAGAGLLFLAFVLSYESYTLGKRRNAVETYAGVISNSLWHFEPQAPTNYLTLTVDEQDYERVRVITEDGLDFVNVESSQPDALTSLVIALKLIRRVEITADIHYQGEIIGKINAIWLNKNIYIYFYVLIVVSLLVGVFWLYWRILQSNRELEMGVQRRTAELHSANIELGESEARYRSIFEDSPISLREEDFSGVKQIIDSLLAAGVQDIQTYFDQHPDTLSACVRAVKVLNVNQNTLELFRTDSKERLYQGLTDIFTEESLDSFGRQLVAFASGQTHFDCETIQQTITGEKLWAGTRVSIAPGYEHTWEKVFVSILDITKRKQAEAGLEQVNQGLNAEIVERKRLQEEVQRYTEELEQRVAERTRELSVLYDVTAVASNVLELDELLSRLLTRSLSAMRRAAGVLHLVDGPTATLRLNTQQGVSEAISDGIAAFYANQGDVRSMFARHASIIITDLCNDERAPDAVRRSGWCTYIGVPIQDTRGQLLGILSIFGDTGEELSVDEKTLLASIADHIGLAVENVRLRRQAEETAVLEDRQRLARELHDAVNQSLFSASVIAETLPRLWERNPLVVQQNLGELHRLIRGALAEMRILLLELRPVSMANAVLGDLLSQLVDGVKGRTQLDVALHIQGQHELPTLVKKNLFRIAQEALNNVVKHARANHVKLTLDHSTERVTLCICDDGQGFSRQDVDGGHLGLQIMRERAEEIGASLTIASQAGSGAKITAVWPGLDDETDHKERRLIDG